MEKQITEADKRGISATEDARRAALKLLRRALKEGVDLRDVTLYHLVTVARETAMLSTGMAVAALAKAELDQQDAAVIAMLLTEQAGAAGGSGVGRVRSLLESGRLREAIQAAQTLPAGSEAGAEAVQLVTAARERLDQLFAQAAAAAEEPTRSGRRPCSKRPPASAPRTRRNGWRRSRCRLRETCGRSATGTR